MSRRSKPARRIPAPDAVYNSVDIASFINRLMRRGKKSIAERIFYSTLENLILLCPNCHALTDNYRGRNINSGVLNVSDEDFVKSLQESSNIRQALISLGLTPKGGNYIRANELIQKYQIEKFLVGAPSKETSCVNDL